jgi:hypothetical protein
MSGCNIGACACSLGLSRHRLQEQFHLHCQSRSILQKRSRATERRYVTNHHEKGKSDSRPESARGDTGHPQAGKTERAQLPRIAAGPCALGRCQRPCAGVGVQFAQHPRYLPALTRRLRVHVCIPPLCESGSGPDSLAVTGLAENAPPVRIHAWLRARSALPTYWQASLVTSTASTPCTLQRRRLAPPAGAPGSSCRCRVASPPLPRHADRELVVLPTGSSRQR